MEKAAQKPFWKVFTLPLPYGAAFALWAVLLAFFPGIDLSISHLFFDETAGTFLSARMTWLHAISFSANLLVFGFLALVAGLYLLGLVRRRPLLVRERILSYFLLAFILGPTLLVTFGLKEHWGRSRPADVVEFGGTHQFTPYYLPSDECQTDCSFSSGHSVRSFYFLTLYFAALAMGVAAKRRRQVLACVIAYGSLIALVRLAEGRHFFSDVTASAIFMAYIALVLYRVMLLRDGQKP